MPSNQCAKNLDKIVTPQFSVVCIVSQNLLSTIEDKKFFGGIDRVLSMCAEKHLNATSVFALKYRLKTFQNYKA